MNAFAEDYVDVAERRRQAAELWPEGRLVSEPFEIREMPDGRIWIICRALFYRHENDPTPASGTAWELYPGKTPYTRDSELMNAETSAWGRALIAAGLPSKKVASADEVRAAASRKDARPFQSPGAATEKQMKTLKSLLHENGASNADEANTILQVLLADGTVTLETISMSLASEAIGHLMADKKAKP